MSTTTVASLGAATIEKKRPYVAVFAILAIVTLLELNVGIFRLASNVQVGTLVIMATAKAALVVAYYMHMRYEPRWLALIPLAGIALVAVLVVALVGIGGPTVTPHP